MSIENQIEGKIYNPSVQLFHDEFRRMGLAEVTEKTLGTLSKEIRPVIEYTLLTHILKEKAVLVEYLGESIGADPSKIRQLAVTCDLLWAISLLYDDIYDNDTSRAGAATAWVKFGRQTTGEAIEKALGTIMSRLNQIVHPYAGAWCLSYIQQGIQSMDDVNKMTPDTPYEQILQNYNLRCNFHQAFPVEVLFKLLGCGSLDQYRLALEALHSGNQAGQIINDLKDCSPRSLGREPFSDVRNAVLTIPIKFLYDDLDQYERLAFGELFGKKQLSPEQIQWLNSQFRDHYVFPRCNNLITHKYNVFTGKLAAVIEPQYGENIQKWVEYKMGVLANVY